MDTLLEPLLRDNDLHHERERVLIVGLAAPTLTCTSRTTVALAQCDVLVHVCGWLAVCDVLSISRTCASIRTAASSKQMWRMLLLRDMHPYSSTVHVHLDVAADTESCYKWRYQLRRIRVEEVRQDREERAAAVQTWQLRKRRMACWTIVWASLPCVACILYAQKSLRDNGMALVAFIPLWVFFAVLMGYTAWRARPCQPRGCDRAWQVVWRTLVSSFALEIAVLIADGGASIGAVVIDAVVWTFLVCVLVPVLLLWAGERWWQTVLWHSLLVWLLGFACIPSATMYIATMVSAFLVGHFLSRWVSSTATVKDVSISLVCNVPHMAASVALWLTGDPVVLVYTTALPLCTLGMVSACVRQRRKLAAVTPGDIRDVFEF